MTASPRGDTSGSTRQIARAALLIMALFLVSRVLGLVREMIIGARFGTSAQLDAYQAAFRVPDLLFQLIAGGAVVSAFLPVFTGCLTRRDPQGRLAGVQRRNEPGAHPADRARGLYGHRRALAGPHGAGARLLPREQALTAELVRWMLISTVIFGFSGIVMGVLNSFQHFLLPAWLRYYTTSQLSWCSGSWRRNTVCSGWCWASSWVRPCIWTCNYWDCGGTARVIPLRWASATQRCVR